MSRLWPHTPYAEDQPYHHLILTTHVLTRAIQTGSLIGMGIGTSLYTLRTFNILSSKPDTSPNPNPISKPPTIPSTSAAPSTISIPRPSSSSTLPLTRTLLHSTSLGALTGLTLLCIGLPFQMHGKEEIEWRDRSWRLLENEGQMECDDWTYTGMAVGGLLGASRMMGTGRGAAGLGTAATGLGWRAVVGGVGLGSVLGMVGYMGWRYGVKGGKREERRAL